MGILILFVLIVGAITIFNFAWKGAVKFWLKADRSELINNQRDIVSPENKFEFWQRSHGWQHDGLQHNGGQNNGFGRGW